MRILRRAVVITLFLLLVFAVLPAPPAAAQDAFNIKIFPAKTELLAVPGSSFEFYVNVHNLGAETEELKVYFMDYYIKENNEFVFDEPGHYSYSCASWMSSAENEITVPPGVIYRSKFGMTVPPDAEPGGHFAVIFFEQMPVPGSPPVKTRPRIGALVLATVPGEIVREGVIESVEVTSTWFWPSRKIPIFPQKKIVARIVFYNKGNVHITVRGKLTFSPTFGWGSGTVFFEEITVLPDTRRYMEAVIPDPPWVGSYEARAQVEYGPTLTEFDTSKMKKSTFNIYPFSLLVALLLLIVVIGVPWWLWRRNRYEYYYEDEEEYPQAYPPQGYDQGQYPPGGYNQYGGGQGAAYPPQTGYQQPGTDFVPGQQPQQQYQQPETGYDGGQYPPEQYRQPEPEYQPGQPPQDPQEYQESIPGQTYEQGVPPQQYTDQGYAPPEGEPPGGEFLDDDRNR
ncbi:MAG: hypothetical protein JW738_08385 [Actinobacteria bacterium]|nr:hypothetical protein [Actinomycetota bacterium]